MLQAKLELQFKGQVNTKVMSSWLVNIKFPMAGLVSKWLTSTFASNWQLPFLNQPNGEKND